MGYSMLLEGRSVAVENDFFSPELVEHNTSFEVDTVSLELMDKSLQHFHLIRGTQKVSRDMPFSITFDTSFYVTHLR